MLNKLFIFLTLITSPAQAQYKELSDLIDLLDQGHLNTISWDLNNTIQLPHLYYEKALQILNSINLNLKNKNEALQFLIQQRELSNLETVPLINVDFSNTDLQIKYKFWRWLDFEIEKSPCNPNKSETEPLQHFIDGVSCFSKKQYKSSINALKKFLENETHPYYKKFDTLAKLLLARGLSREHKLEESITALRTVSIYNNLYPKALEDLLWSAFQQNDKELALGISMSLQKGAFKKLPLLDSLYILIQLLNQNCQYPLAKRYLDGFLTNHTSLIKFITQSNKPFKIPGTGINTLPDFIQNEIRSNGNWQIYEKQTNLIEKEIIALSKIKNILKTSITSLEIDTEKLQNSLKRSLDSIKDSVDFDIPASISNDQNKLKNYSELLIKTKKLSTYWTNFVENQWSNKLLNTKVKIKERAYFNAEQSYSLRIKVLKEAFVRIKWISLEIDTKLSSDFIHGYYKHGVKNINNKATNLTQHEVSWGKQNIDFEEIWEDEIGFSRAQITNKCEKG